MTRMEVILRSNIDCLPEQLRQDNRARNAVQHHLACSDELRMVPEVLEHKCTERQHIATAEIDLLAEP
eukprot:CAMPEP_0178451560 /NCGR_PEP_ID=MMETSP0689_2-20121128/43753_1 /TAXON_ID=160604 /ORGANISM="Amphidinium massartii, Strain CS-259" /LENGTH=67 /DNA_ID=CAMNT_0020077161 /DNA_START=1960 /DNA_END=2163 /DNA_ORIENTATION=-